MWNMQNGFFSNDSTFGKLMTRIGIVIGANLMFIVFSLPVFTMGAAWTALCYTMMKMLQSEEAVNPFKLFWKGFKMNFKQASLVWVISVIVIVIAVIDIQFCMQSSGMIAMFRYPIYVICTILILVLLYLFPVMAAFADSILHLIRNSLYFMMHKPLKLLIIAFIIVYPLYQCYTDLTLQPMYAFIYAFFGFGLTALVAAWLLMPEFRPFLKNAQH